MNNYIIDKNLHATSSTKISLFPSATIKFIFFQHSHSEEGWVKNFLFIKDKVIKYSFILNVLILFLKLKYILHNFNSNLWKK